MPTKKKPTATPVAPPVQTTEPIAPTVEPVVPENNTDADFLASNEAEKQAPVSEVIGLDSNNEPFTQSDLDNATLVQISDPTEVEGVVRAEETDEETFEPVIKSGFMKVKAEQFRGSYKDAQFDDDGVCPRISKGTLELLQMDFPGIKIVEAEEI